MNKEAAAASNLNMKHKYLAALGMTLFAAMAVTAFGLGKNAQKTADILRKEASNQRAEAERMDSAAGALSDITSTKNGERARSNERDAARENDESAAQGVHELLKGDHVKAAQRAKDMAENIGETRAEEMEAANRIANDRLRADLNEARDREAKAQKNAEVLDKIADALEKKAAETKAAEAKAAEQKAAEKKAEKTPSGDGGHRDGGIGRGDSREFHGNDRAAEKADRTG